MTTSECIKLITDFLTAVATMGLLYVTWIYTKATKDMANTMARDFESRVTPEIGGSAPKIVKDSWSEVIVEQEIENVGERNFLIEDATLELSGLVTEGPSRILGKTTLNFPQHFAAGVKVKFRFVVDKRSLDKCFHVNVSSPLSLLKPEVFYTVRNMNGTLYTPRYTALDLTI